MADLDQPSVRASDLDQVIHSPKRLVLMAILNTVAEVEFSYLRDRLELSESDLSKQMSTLAKADLVKVRKTGGGRVGKTWYSLTKTGSTPPPAEPCSLGGLACRSGKFQDNFPTWKVIPLATLPRL